jgi:hypothetical protein
VTPKRMLLMLVSVVVKENQTNRKIRYWKVMAQFPLQIQEFVEQSVACGWGYIYIYIYTYMYTYIYTHIHTHTYTHTHFLLHADDAACSFWRRSNAGIKTRENCGGGVWSLAARPCHVAGDPAARCQFYYSLCSQVTLRPLTRTLVSVTEQISRTVVRNTWHMCHAWCLMAQKVAREYLARQNKIWFFFWILNVWLVRLILYGRSVIIMQ